MPLAAGAWRSLFKALAVIAAIAAIAAALVVVFAPQGAGALLLLTLGVLAAVLVAEIVLLLMAPKPQE